MHSRRLACLLLGIWIGAGLLMALVALDSSRSVDRILRNPGPGLSLQIKAFGPNEARLLVEYQAVQRSRWLFEAWSIAQIVLGAVFFFFLLFGTGEGKAALLLALVMLAAVLGQQLLQMPGLFAAGGRAGADAVPSGAGAVAFADNGYWVVEIGKLAAGLALAFRLIRRHGSSGHARQKLDLVNEADHGHVNRRLRSAHAAHGGCTRRWPAARLSPTPAPMASSATTASPRFEPSSSRGCTSSRLRPSWLGCFRVATISPMTRAISMAQAPFQMDGVHDARDGSVHRHVPRAGRHSWLPGCASSRPFRPRRRPSSRRTPAACRSICSSGVRGCTSSRRWPSRWLSLTVDQTHPTTRPSNMSIQPHVVDDADDGGIHGQILAAVGHAGRTAGDHQNALA